jgi:hypothetical protein
MKLRSLCLVASFAAFLLNSTSASAATDCYTFRINYPSGEKVCGVRCASDNSSHTVPCDSDLIRDHGIDQEYGQHRIGTSGSDYLTGTAGADLIELLAANDAGIGQAGNDWIEGGGANDQINGGPGDDLLFGDNGDDRYFYAAGDGVDVVIDGVGANWLTLSSDLQPLTSATQSGDDLVLWFSGSTDSVTLVNYYTQGSWTIDFGNPALFPH